MKSARRLLALVLLGVAAPLLACARPPDQTEVPASASSTVISMQGVDCESCGARAIEAVTKRPGVYAASFDRVRAELTVQYDATQAAPADFVAVVEQLGYVGIEGAGQGAYIPEAEFAAGLDVAKVSEAGEAVVLEDHLAAGKVTVFDFYAVWCEPCRKVDEHMQKVLAAHPDVALRKIDVVDWDSEAAKQHLRDVSDLPYVVVFGPGGKQVAAISGLALAELDAAIEKARRK
jgi:thiol-disulfide isomerase/thioredoxin/copper chaperone CopZ